MYILTVLWFSYWFMFGFTLSRVGRQILPDFPEATNAERVQIVAIWLLAAVVWPVLWAVVGWTTLYSWHGERVGRTLRAKEYSSEEEYAAAVAKYEAYCSKDGDSEH